MAETRLDWPRLLDEALTVPGNLGNTYNRFWDYSLTNCLLFRIQGLHEPVASYRRWQSLGRHVVQGARAKEVIVPVLVKEKPPEEETLDEKRERVARLIGFKVVNAVFGYSDTEGKELPEPPTPRWDLQQALAKFGIREVPYDSVDGNMQGYSRGLEFAINPMAVNRTRTTFHEIGHIILGHTTALSAGEFLPHRGLREFEAEATSYLVGNELGIADDAWSAHSRGYIQHWLHNEQPPDTSIRRVCRAAEAVLKAGRVALEGE